MSEEEEIPKWQLAADNWVNGNRKDAIAQAVTLDDADSFRFCRQILSATNVTRDQPEAFRVALQLAYQQGMQHGEETGAQKLWMALDRARIEFTADPRFSMRGVRTGRTSAAQPNVANGPRSVPAAWDAEKMRFPGEGEDDAG